MKETEIRTRVSQVLVSKIITDSLDNRYILAGTYHLEDLVNEIVNSLK